MSSKLTQIHQIISNETVVFQQPVRVEYKSRKYDVMYRLRVLDAKWARVEFYVIDESQEQITPIIFTDVSGADMVKDTKVQVVTVADSGNTLLNPNQADVTYTTVLGTTFKYTT